MLPAQKADHVTFPSGAIPTVEATGKASPPTQAFFPIQTQFTELSAQVDAGVTQPIAGATDEEQFTALLAQKADHATLPAGAILTVGAPGKTSSPTQSFFPVQTQFTELSAQVDAGATGEEQLAVLPAQKAGHATLPAGAIEQAPAAVNLGAQFDAGITQPIIGAPDEVSPPSQTLPVFQKEITVLPAGAIPTVGAIGEASPWTQQGAQEGTRALLAFQEEITVLPAGAIPTVGAPGEASSWTQQGAQEGTQALLAFQEEITVLPVQKTGHVRLPAGAIGQVPAAVNLGAQFDAGATPPLVGALDTASPSAQEGPQEGTQAAFAYQADDQPAYDLDLAQLVEIAPSGVYGV